MSDYVDKLEYLEETKSLIKGALKAKGVSVSDTDTFRSYADKIQNIQSGGSGGFEEGYQAGKEDGLEEGETIGYNKGYPAGYSDGEAYGKANAPTENLNVTLKSNGTFNYPKPSDKYYADVAVTVSVPSEKTPTQEKSITIKENGTEEILPDDGFALHKVTVTTQIDTRLPEQTKEVTIRENGTTDISPDDGYTLAGVSVTTDIDTRLPEQEKSLEVTENKVYEVTPDDGYALSKVTVTGNVASSGGGDDGQLAKITTLSADEWNVPASNGTNFASLMKTIDWTEFNKLKHKNFYRFFYYYQGHYIDVHNLDISNATDMSSMFQLCSYLTSLDLSSFNTEKVTNMSNMFSNCSYLTSLGLSSFNTSNVTNMSSMFSNCSYLTSLDLSSFNTEKVTLMSSMFSSCSSLTSVTFGNNWVSNRRITSFDIKSCPLSKDSILDLANKIADKSDKSVYTGTYKVSLKSSQKSLFTADELTALAGQFTAKNWTLAWS